MKQCSYHAKGPMSLCNLQQLNPVPDGSSVKRRRTPTMDSSQLTRSPVCRRSRANASSLPLATARAGCALRASISSIPSRVVNQQPATSARRKASTRARWFSLSPPASIRTVVRMLTPARSARCVARSSDRPKLNLSAQARSCEGGAPRSRAARAVAIFITSRREPWIGWKS